MARRRRPPPPVVDPDAIPAEIAAGPAVAIWAPGHYRAHGGVPPDDRAEYMSAMLTARRAHHDAVTRWCEQSGSPRPPVRRPYW